MSSIKNVSTKWCSKRILKNIFIVIGIGLSSMISTQAAKAIYQDEFNATYFVAFTTTIFNTLVFPIYLIFHVIFKINPQNKSELLKKCIEPYKSSQNCSIKQTLFSFMWKMILFTGLWISAIYTYIKSLMYLSSTDVSTLFSTSSVFVFLLSIFILKEKFYFLKVLINFLYFI